MPQGVQLQQVVGGRPHGGEPAADRARVMTRGRRGTAREGRGTLDVGVRRAQPAQHGGRVIEQQCGQQDRVASLDRHRAGARQTLVVDRLELGHPPLRRADPPPEVYQLRNRSGRAQTLEPLVSHALGGELRQSGSRLDRGGPCGRIDREAEARGKTQASEDAEIVLPEALGGITHRADRPALQVGAPIEGIAPLVPQRVIGDGVDREVTAGEIVVKRDAVRHDRVPPVRGHVPSEGGHLVEHSAPVEDAHRAVLLADRSGVAEKAHDLRGRRRGGEIEVGVRVAQERVAERAAHAPGLEPGGLQGACDLQHLVRNRRTRGGRHRPPYATPAERARTSSMRACDGVRGPAGIAPMATVRAPPPSNA